MLQTVKAKLWRSFSYLFDTFKGPDDYLVARWLFLRALGAIYAAVFFALLFQAHGLIGSHGILPASEFLGSLGRAGASNFWYAPTLLWVSSADAMLTGICWAGFVASLLTVGNVAPRWMLAVCFCCFLSFVGAAQEFSGYQSDGMLLEAGFLSLFVAPSGWRPGIGLKSLPARAAMFLLLLEWFRIYFESGIVKLSSGDQSWRDLTAMYVYYQNGPLPTWIGWYLQHLPNWFHLATAGLTLAMELVFVWMAFLPRKWRLVCFVTVTVWQAGVIATANYAFLNYLVLVLAIFLLDDRFLLQLAPWKWTAEPTLQNRPASKTGAIAVAAICLTWIGYATTVPLIQMIWTRAPLPTLPVALIEPFRIANSYGLFAVMTPHRYEIEFQGSNDGQNWTAYPFRYKPQDIGERPRIYAPYQPRFDWNLWFASLGTWQQYPFVENTELRLLQNEPSVVALFRRNPFGQRPPLMVRAVIWQHWFSTPEQKRASHVWWRREFLGQYAPTVRLRVAEPQ